MGLPLTLQYFIFLFLIFSSSPQQAMSRVPHNNLTDLESLLAFKAGVYDPDDFIATNWTTDASFCDSWFGVKCSRRRQRVVELDIRNIFLHGTISPHLGNLSFLSYLNLGSNNLKGPIPSSIGRLPRLAVLFLQRNKLNGTIPPSIFNMSSLLVLNLASNDLTGPLLPSNTDPFMLPRLQQIYLHHNLLTGNIPSQFAQCSQLMLLSLAGNELSGSIPPELGNITGLQYLYLGGNKLRGTIPASIGNLTTLQRLGLGSNYLEGSIPKEIGKLLNLKVLQLQRNNLTGSIPAALFNTSHLEFIDLSRNKLNGVIPPTLENSWPQLTLLNNYLNLLQRLNIMVDVSLALEYLHHYHPQIIVHCDLKPSNVLFDESMTAHVSDFGISKLLLGDRKSSWYTNAAGTLGYMAPEYASTGKVSRKTDVYSFGILLLETLTRKKPGDDMFKEGLSLRQWVTEANPDAVLDIVDSNFLTDDYRSPREGDPLINVHECLSSLSKSNFFILFKFRCERFC